VLGLGRQVQRTQPTQAETAGVAAVGGLDGHPAGSLAADRLLFEDPENVLRGAGRARQGAGTLEEPVDGSKQNSVLAVSPPSLTRRSVVSSTQRALAEGNGLR
jgi:hypothetical protein